MKKKYIVIIAILIAFAMAVTVGVCISRHNNKNNEKEHMEKDNEIVINVPEEDENESSEEEEEEVQAESPSVTFDESVAVVAWTTSNLNLREQPSGNSTVITVISKGTEMKKGTEENGWAQVKVGDTIGYVSTQYISDTKPEEKPVEQNATQTPNTSKVEAIPGQHRDPNNIVIVIDPGHQLRGDNNKEPNGPGSTTMKARVTSGTTGVATGVAEYILNLDISLKLKAELENRGYVVHMTRSTHDVNISNKERAEYANSVNADIAVRIHANGAGPSVRGAETLAPSAGNPYVSHLSKASISLSRCVINAYCAATGFSNRGVKTNDTMTGINWSSVPVTIIELGFMSNAEEDRAMQDAIMQNNMVQGIANGIDAYFGM
jgi:N-acetylmuramoyl-L-alanine amidase